MAAVALQESCGLGSLKWPNDLLDPSGKKLAGILLEARWSGELDFLLIGIGVNVRAGSWPDGAAAVGAWRWVNRARLLRSLLESLECWWGKPPEAVLRRWWELSAHRGKPVALRRAGVLLTGLADGLEPDGSLRVIGANGTARISAGEVAWIGGLE
jgi:BirA family biotin operon repressor/biotin-[acetyl-CoA-carboxylase] ligase